MHRVLDAIPSVGFRSVTEFRFCIPCWNGRVDNPNPRTIISGKIFQGVINKRFGV